MKSDRLIALILAGLAVLLALWIMFAPAHAQASLVLTPLTPQSTQVILTAQQQAHLDWVNSIDAPKNSPRLAASPSIAVDAPSPSVEMQIRKLQAEIARLSALITALSR